MSSVLLLLKRCNSGSSSFSSLGYKEAPLWFLVMFSVDVCTCAVLHDAEHGEQLDHKRFLMLKASVPCLGGGLNLLLGQTRFSK